MVNRPKMLGTAAETAVERWLQEHGHPYAERRSLKGSLDKGDITGCPGLCIEVKVAGRQGLKLGPWLKETEQERVNARADYGILVAKPKGLGPKRTARWLAAMYQGAWDRLMKQVGLLFGVPLQEVSGAKISKLPDMLKDSMGPYLVRAVATPDPKDWYVVTDLEEMNFYLLKAGYGTAPAGREMGDGKVHEG